MDGVIDSGTAVMVEGYADASMKNGEPLFSAEEFSEIAIEADRRGRHDGTPLEPTISLRAYSYAWQTLRKAGVRLAFGSDWRVSDINPLRGIHAAVTRKARKEGLPEQRQSLQDTLLGCTADGAWTEFMEDRKGRLKPGMLADIVVLSEDVEAVAPEEIERLDPTVTICDGRITYEA